MDGGPERPVEISSCWSSRRNWMYPLITSRNHDGAPVSFGVYGEGPAKPAMAIRLPRYSMSQYIDCVDVFY